MCLPAAAGEVRTIFEHVESNDLRPVSRFGKPDLATRIELEQRGDLVEQGLHSSGDPRPHWTLVDAGDFRRKTGHLLPDGTVERF